MFRYDIEPEDCLEKEERAFKRKMANMQQSTAERQETGGRPPLHERMQDCRDRAEAGNTQSTEPSLDKPSSKSGHDEI